jgi:hypothetical protein
MRKKTALYDKQQDEIVQKLISILELDNDDSITLYALDNDEDKIRKIMDLIPEIRMFFSFGNIVGVSEPEKVKRPWLSIIKILTRKKYRMFKSDFRIQTDKELIRTKKYTFVEKKTT